MGISGLPAFAISFAALAVSIYGVVERRGAARRAERIQFVSLVDELNRLRLDHPERTTITQHGSLTYAINETAEVPAIQALGMARRPALRRLTSSPEFRTIAYALGR